MINSLSFANDLSNIPGGQPLIFLLSVIILSILFRFVFWFFLKIAKVGVSKTKTKLDDRIVDTVSKFLFPMSLLLATFVSMRLLNINIIVRGLSEVDIFLILFVAIITFMLVHIVDILLIWYGSVIHPRRHKVSEKDIFPFLRNLIKLAIFAFFIVFVLQRAGFDTTALITGLGIGGLAVALALQDTLSNFFAGIHILVDKPFREDDYIKIDDKSEGTVRKIGWRTTKLLTITQNEIYIPNSKLSNAIVENFSSPKENCGVYYSIGVDYKEDIDHVVEVIGKVLKKVEKKNKFMVPNTQWYRFDRFDDFTLLFKFGYHVMGYTNRFGVWRDVQHAMFYAFKKEDISIPFPTRILYHHNSPIGVKRKK